MKPNIVRYTATLPENYLNELKGMAKEKIIPSVNFAINEAVDKYLKNKKADAFLSLMKEAGRDKAFLARTMRCSDDFNIIDSEIKKT